LLKGLALSCAAAQQFVGNLGGPGPFESISLARVERQQNNAERVEYQIDCVLRTTD
jgi:hypothetical protein